MIWPFLVILWMTAIIVSKKIFIYLKIEDPVGNAALVGAIAFVIGGIILNWRVKIKKKKEQEKLNKNWPDE